ncbi:MAG: hypothetical protein KDI50_06315 [Candidatus Competibacteraceae bacterium]|nr:hypothetical protein [Candidatus Competibacteraceae bacterium]
MDVPTRVRRRTAPGTRRGQLVPHSLVLHTGERASSIVGRARNAGTTGRSIGTHDPNLAAPLGFTVEATNTQKAEEKNGSYDGSGNHDSHSEAWVVRPEKAKHECQHENDE